MNKDPILELKDQIDKIIEQLEESSREKQEKKNREIEDSVDKAWEINR